LAKARIFPPQFQKVDMQIVKLSIFLALGKIEFTAGEYFRIVRRRQSGQLFSLREEKKGPQPLGAAFPNGIAHRCIAYVGKKHEWARRAEFLSLKQQRRPGAEQEKTGHRAITRG